MPQLTAGKKKKKATQSNFEKLWQKAERLQRQNAQLRARLDELIESTEQKIRPIEKDAAEADIPLLKKLLTLGQRKSLARWERQILDQWIRELIKDMQVFGLTDNDLLNDIARYDAFQLGIDLDEASDETATPHEQVSEFIQQLQKDEEDAWQRAAEEEQADVASMFDDMQNTMDDLIEKILDEKLGPPPAQDRKHAYTFDLLQDELDQELEKQLQEYQQKRAEFREQLLAELFDEGDSPDEDSDNPFFDFDADFEDEDTGRIDRAKPAIDNATFQKMFRATAARLHPDREPDEKKRAIKQKLMAELLSARKQGDLLTVLRLYQQHTDNRESFSNADEKQLIEALTRQIEQLQDEKEQIIFQSPTHHTLYERFYHSSEKKQNEAIEKHMQQIRNRIPVAQEMADTITSLKSLRPWLDDRYQWRQFANMANI